MFPPDTSLVAKRDAPPNVSKIAEVFRRCHLRFLDSLGKSDGALGNALESDIENDNVQRLLAALFALFVLHATPASTPTTVFPCPLPEGHKCDLSQSWAYFRALCDLLKSQKTEFDVANFRALVVGVFFEIIDAMEGTIRKLEAKAAAAAASSANGGKLSEEGGGGDRDSGSRREAAALRIQVWFIERERHRRMVRASAGPIA